jgi:phage portal protein BeeE
MDTALTVPAFYAGVAYIAEDVGKLPLNMYEDLGDEGHRPAPNHYLQRKLHDQPNRHQTALEFREMMTAFAMLRKFAIAERRTRRRAADRSSTTS